MDVFADRHWEKPESPRSRPGSPENRGPIHRCTADFTAKIGRAPETTGPDAPKIGSAAAARPIFGANIGLVRAAQPISTTKIGHAAETKGLNAAQIGNAPGAQAMDAREIGEIVADMADFRREIRFATGPQPARRGFQRRSLETKSMADRAKWRDADAGRISVASIASVAERGSISPAPSASYPDLERFIRSLAFPILGTTTIRAALAKGVVDHLGGT